MSVRQRLAAPSNRVRTYQNRYYGESCARTRGDVGEDADDSSDRGLRRPLRGLAGKGAVVRVERRKTDMGLERIIFAAIAVSICIFCAATCEKKFTPPEEGFQAAHERLMAIIEESGVKDKLVLAAVRKVKRHLFVSPAFYDEAYDDRPLAIGEGQTISQPSLVAKMTELLELKGGEKVLEIGTGSGYQAAILAEIAKEVYTIEIVPALAQSADKRLKELGYKNITVRCGDGYRGWQEKAPFDAIIVTCGAPEILQPLVRQLREGGIMVSPVGEDPGESVLKKITKRGNSIIVDDIFGVGFVPMTGEVQKKKEK